MSTKLPAKATGFKVNDSLRIATGAFKTTPVSSLRIIANEMPLQLRRDEQILKYYYKMRVYLGNPSRTLVITVSEERLFINKRIPPPFPIRAKEVRTRYEIEGHVKPYF